MYPGVLSGVLFARIRYMFGNLPNFYLNLFWCTVRRIKRGIERQTEREFQRVSEANF